MAASPKAAKTATTGNCQVDGCGKNATESVKQASTGKDLGYCTKHAQQMVNLTGFTEAKATRIAVRLASLWGRFTQWAASTGIDPFNPAAVGQFGAEFGVDTTELLSMLSQRGGGPIGGDTPIAPAGGAVSSGDDFGGIPDSELELRER